MSHSETEKRILMTNDSTVQQNDRQRIETRVPQDTMRSILMLTLGLMMAVMLVVPLVGCKNMEGSYRVIEGSWGQAQSGAAIVFDNGHCNLYSPNDTYVFDDNELTVTGLLGGSITFEVTFIEDTVELHDGMTKLVLQRQGR
jgi:hypothetical protein